VVLDHPMMELRDFELGDRVEQQHLLDNLVLLKIKNSKVLIK
jgi:hypothetical protein